MIEGFKGRTYRVGDKIRVYRNLNNGKWSLLAMEGQYKNKVVGHLDSLSIADVSFIVSVAGQNKVKRENRRCVHAYAQGFLTSLDSPTLNSESSIVTYDPFGRDFFFKTTEDSNRLESLPYLNFSQGKAFI